MDGSTNGSEGDQTPASPRPWGPEEECALRLWISLARAYATFARAVSNRVVDFGLTIPQFGVLEALLHVGPLPLGELADKLLVTGGNVTYVMDRLEEQGLVRRERSSQDRRVVMAHLTPEGRGLVEEVFPRHARQVRKLVSHLPMDEQKELRRLLKRLGKEMAAAEGAAGEAADPGVEHTPGGASPTG